MGRGTTNPGVDIGVVPHAQGAAGKDQGPDVIIVRRGLYGLLVRLGGAGLVGENEAGTDPDGASAHHESSGQ